MRVPHSVRLRALSYLEAEQLPKAELAPAIPEIIGYLPHPDVPEAFVFELSQDARASSSIATTPDASNRYPVTVTHKSGWALVRWTDIETGNLNARLWFAGSIPASTKNLITGAYLVEPQNVKTLTKLLGLPQQMVEAALRNVGPRYATDSLKLLEWLSKETKYRTWPEFRNEVQWLWYWCQHGGSGLTIHLAMNPVISLQSPNLRVVMYGAKCAAMA